MRNPHRSGGEEWTHHDGLGHPYWSSEVKLGSLICPTCGQAMARDEGRRFMENGRYVECPRGHAWQIILRDADSPDGLDEVVSGASDDTPTGSE